MMIHNEMMIDDQMTKLNCPRWKSPHAEDCAD